MSAAAAWDEIVRAALLGTERHPASAGIATGDAALDGAIAALAERPAEARLLGTAALLDGWRRAGQRPMRTAAVPPEPAPDVDERPCSPLAGRVLRQLLAGGPPAVLAEWMTLAARAGVAIPHELLPGVLEHRRRHHGTREAVDGALGPRGRWLAAQRPGWSPPAAPAADPAEVWQTGTFPERLQALTRLRRSDPAAGIALLRATWASEAPADRVGFIERLADGLGMDDEPFLESALDDRRKDVRIAAANLLSRLPDSRLVRRMVDRLLPLLALREPDGLLSRIRKDGPRLETTLPAECDRGMRRDGVEPKPPHGTGERAWWMHQMLAAVPPSVWTAHWKRRADELLRAARAGEDGDLVIRAWTEAAVRVRDPAWAEARMLMETAPRPLGGWGALAGILPAERLEALVSERVRDAGQHLDDFTAELLDEARFSWSPALTRTVLASVPAPRPSNLASRMRGYVLPTHIAARLSGYALRMHPATAVAVLHEWGDPYEGEWVDLIHLRHTLHQAFS